MKVIFTDYDTVKIGTEEEVTTKKFFKEFEYLIKNGEITNCNYNPENEEFSFSHDNEIYTIKITNKSLAKLRTLLSLMKLEQNKSNKKQTTAIIKNENEKLLKLARNGEIVSEKAKELYLKELKSAIKLSNMFKGFKLQDFAWNLFNLDVSNTKKWAEPITVVLLFISFISSIGTPILFTEEIIKITPAIIIAIASFLEFIIGLATHDEGGSLLARGLTYISWGIINFFGNLIKINIDLARAIIEFIPRASLIRHKVKSLKNYQLPSEEIVMKQKTERNDNDVLTSYIAKSIDNIYLNLLKLNDEDKKEIRKELETKLKEYQMSLLNLPKSGLTLETEVTVSNRLIMALAEIELKINQKLNAELKSNLITSSIERINEEIENNKVKQRVLKM